MPNNDNQIRPQRPSRESTASQWALVVSGLVNLVAVFWALSVDEFLAEDRKNERQLALYQECNDIRSDVRDLVQIGWSDVEIEHWYEPTVSSTEAYFRSFNEYPPDAATINQLCGFSVKDVAARARRASEPTTDE